MKVSLKSLFQFTARHFREAPTHFILLQTLNGLSGLVAKALESRFENSPLLAGALFFPIFCIASTLTCALTFISVNERENGRRVNLTECFELLKPRLKSLVGASLALGFLFVLGLAALILPALYFMAIYLFVPLLLVSNSQMTLSPALYRSSKMIKNHRGTAAFTVFVILLVGVLTFLVSYSLGRFAGGITSIEALRFWVSAGIDAFLTMLTGAMIDLWIAGFFMKVQKSQNL